MRQSSQARGFEAAEREGRTMDACRAQAPGGGSSRGGQYPRMPGVDRACGGAAGLHVLTGGGMLRCQPGPQPRIGKARPPASGRLGPCGAPPGLFGGVGG